MENLGEIILAVIGLIAPGGAVLWYVLRRSYNYQVQRLEQADKDTQQRIADFRDRVDELETTQKDMELSHTTERQQWSEKTERLNDRIGALENENEQLRSSVNVLETAYKSLKVELDQANDARTELENKLTLTQRDLKVAEGQIADLQLIKIRLEARNEAQEETITVLRAMVEPMTKLVDGIILEQTNKRNKAA